MNGLQFTKLELSIGRTTLAIGARFGLLPIAIVYYERSDRSLWATLEPG